MSQHAIAFGPDIAGAAAADALTRALPLTFNFTTQAVYQSTEDLQNVGLNALQMVWIDNSLSPAPTILQFTGPSNQKIVVGPFTQGYYALEGSPQMLDYSVSNFGGGAPFTAGAPLLVPIHFLNCIIDSDLQWNSQPAFGQQGTSFAASTTAANGALVLTMPAIAGRRSYITGFTVTGAGSTAGSAGNVTLSGIDNAGAAVTLDYAFVAPTGVLVAASPLLVNFSPPALVTAGAAAQLAVAPFGAGNTIASATLNGFYV